MKTFSHRRITRRWRPILADLLGQAIARIPSRPLHRIYAAEVGAFDGATARYLFGQFPDLYIYMIDPWAPQADWQESLPDAEDGMRRWKWKDFEFLFRGAMDMTAEYASRRLVCRATSLMAVCSIADGSLYLAFLDGDHREEAVYDDILAYWPKLRPGGVLAIHDYHRSRRRETHPGVRKAVDRWAEECSMPFETDEIPGLAWFCKPL